MLLRTPDETLTTLRIDREQNTTAPAEKSWPAEADLILSALDAASASEYANRPASKQNRRGAGRQSYRVRGELKFFSDRTDMPPWILYTRNVTPRGAGFITPHRLPLGYGGKVQLMTPNGRALKVNCTLIRCRETASGWYEGALNFNREQWEFQY